MTGQQQTTEYMTAREVYDAFSQRSKWYVVEHVTTHGIWDDDDNWVRDEETVSTTHVQADSPLVALYKAVMEAGRFPSLIPGKWRVVGVRE